MARIAGVNIPTNKRVIIALTYIHGIGPAHAEALTTKLNIAEDRRVQDLTDQEVLQIREAIDAGELKPGMRLRVPFGGAGAEQAGERPVFVRADGRAPYQAVARVMARLSNGGFTKLNLITDTAPEASPSAAARSARTRRPVAVRFQPPFHFFWSSQPRG